MKITGLDKLSRDLADAERALEGLDGELGTVSFNPSDPGSIEAAIEEVERLVEGRLGNYASNPIIGRSLGNEGGTAKPSLIKRRRLVSKEIRPSAT